MSQARVMWVAGLVGLLGLVGCGSSRLPPAPGAQAQASAQCSRRNPAVALLRVDDARQGQAVALARLDDRTLAFVADEDDANLHTVDLSTGRELTTTPLAGSPSQVLVLKDGRLAVTLRDRNQLQILEPTASADRPLDTLCSVDLPTEPIALAASPDDKTLLVTSGWGQTLSALDTATLQVAFRVALAREPRAVLFSDDGTQAFVSHAVGSRLSAVDLRTPEHPVRTIDMAGSDPNLGNRSVRTPLHMLKGNTEGQRIGCQSYALARSVDPPGRIFAPQVLVDPGNSEIPTGGYGDGFLAAEVASVGVFDESTGEPLRVSLQLRPGDGQLRHDGHKECLLPRTAITDASRRALFVGCMGADVVVEYDASSADPRNSERRRWSVPSGPVGLAADRLGQRLVVWSQFDQTLSIVSLADSTEASRPATMALSRKAKTATDGDIALGRKLFHSTNNALISQDGRACASCHPDGRDDSLTWATPDGPRNTPMLAGRLRQTGPFGWNGSSDTVQGHVHQTFQRLRGSGLGAHELAALDAYLLAIRTPSPSLPQHGPEAARVARGKAVFESAEAACSSCHHTADGTFVDGAKHDISSQARGDREPHFDTPTLRFLSGTAPYFHDGRYRTLREMLVGADGKMGHVNHLPAEDLDALEAYHKTL